VKNQIIGLKVLTGCGILSLMNKKSFVSKLKARLNGEVESIGQSVEMKNWAKKQFESWSKFGGSQIVMKMGN
jgi:hypothetical protein